MTTYVHNMYNCTYICNSKLTHTQGLLIRQKKAQSVNRDFLRTLKKIRNFVYNVSICISKYPEWSKTYGFDTKKNNKKNRNPFNNPKEFFFSVDDLNLRRNLYDANRPK